MDGWKAKALAASKSAQDSAKSAYEKHKPVSGSQSSATASPAANADRPLPPARKPPPSLPGRSSYVSPNASTRPVPSAPAAPVRTYSDQLLAQNDGLKPFSQYTLQDKEEFFTMLDDFFAGKPPPSMPSLGMPKGATAINSAPAVPQSRAFAPTTRASAPVTKRVDTNAPSYPPPTNGYKSSALELLHYILYEAFTSDWWIDSPYMPLPLVGRNDVRMTASSMHSGQKASILGVAVFGDCSMVWWRLTWSTDSPREVQREGRHRPIPSPWDGEQLYNASERYGPTLVQFAEQAVTARNPVARGECWDLANEGIKSFGTAAHEAPLPSIGRTHGMIIYYARIGGTSLWTGGDPYIRGGDIVEWRKVRISEVGAGAGGYSTLGDPDHTAIILEASPPTSVPEDGESYAVAELVSITVVEQSLGQLPRRVEYDMTKMTAGEIWIYRPASLQEVLGCAIEPVWPTSDVGHSYEDRV